MPSVSPDNRPRLWDFSLAYYARTGVAEACLRLQDEQGVNVNLLLWCMWLEKCGWELDTARLRAAQKHIHAWDEHYVVPLRHLRRRMKAEYGVADRGIEDVREQIKQAELLAEKQLQTWLETETQTWPRTETHHLIPGANLRLYLQQFNLTETLIAQLLELLEGAPASMVKHDT